VVLNLGNFSVKSQNYSRLYLNVFSVVAHVQLFFLVVVQRLRTTVVFGGLFDLIDLNKVHMERSFDFFFFLQKTIIQAFSMLCCC
jgi:hypothetical protein